MLGSVTTTTISPLFVGRKPEIATLTTAAAHSAEGSPATVLLSGEAGVGKTRLLATFTERLCTHASPPRVLTGYCVQLSTEGLAYAPITAMLRQLLHQLSLEMITNLLPEGGITELAHLLPEFGEATHDPNTEAAHARLFHLILTLFEQVSQKRPLVLICEDAHWADASSRDLLTFLVRHISTPVLIVISYRSDDLHRTHPLRRTLSELARLSHVTQLNVPRLSKEEVAVQMRSISGTAPDLRILDSVYARSEGIPLFVETFTQRDVGCLPQSLADHITLSVEKCPEETQHLLRLVAAAGVSVEHQLLATVANLDDASVENALLPAIQRNLLTPNTYGYSFRHALIQEAIHNDLLPAERMRVHTQYASSIEENPELITEGYSSLRAAYHWHAAGNRPRALTSAWDAARHAEKMLAYSEAVQFYERVLEMWNYLPDTERQLNVEYVHVLECAVHAAHTCGEHEKALKFSKEALRELDAEREPERVALLLRQQAHSRSKTGRSGILELLYQAEQLADTPTLTRAKVLESLATFLFLTGHDVEAGRVYAEEAARIAEQHEHNGMILNVGIATAMLLNRSGDRRTGVEQLERIYRDAQRDKKLNVALRALINLSDTLTTSGDATKALTLIEEEGIPTARRLGFYRGYGSMLELNRVEALVAIGRWSEAQEIIERMRHTEPSLNLVGLLEYQRAQLALAAGDLRTARDAMNTVQQIFSKAELKVQEIVPRTEISIAVALAEGDVHAAYAETQRALKELEDVTYTYNTWPLLWSFIAACHAVGREADSTAETLREIAYTLLTTSPTPGDAEYGYYFMITGKYLKAANVWEKCKNPHRRAIALTRAAEQCAREGERSTAREYAQQAHAVAQELGAHALAQEAESVAQRFGSSLTPEKRSAPQNTLGLTTRESEVLALLAEGRSNREIADTLFISAKTASVHVSHILAKLDVSTRGEAAARYRGVH